MSNTDVLISVRVTSDLDVWRTGFSLSAPFRIYVLPLKACHTISSCSYNQKTNGSLSFPPVYWSKLVTSHPTLLIPWCKMLQQLRVWRSCCAITIKRRVPFLICRLQHPSWERHSCAPPLFKLIHKSGISLSEGTEPRWSFRCFISK